MIEYYVKIPNPRRVKEGDFLGDVKSLKDMLQDSNIEDFTVVEDDSPREVEIQSFGDAKSNKIVGHDISLTKLAYYHVQGYTNAELASVFGVSSTVIKKNKESEEYKALLNTISAEIVSTGRMFLQSAGIKAVRTLIHCLDSPNDKIKLQASKEVLDRIGLKEPDKLEVIAKGDAISSMSEEELLGLVKMGMSEIMPKIEGDS